MCVDGKMPGELSLHSLFQEDQTWLVITFALLLNAASDLLHTALRISDGEINLPDVSLSDFFRCIDEMDDKFPFCSGTANRH